MVERPRARRRLYLLLGGVALGALVIGVAWIVITGLLARSRLNEARAQLPELRKAVTSGDVNRADSLIRKIQGETSSAHALTSGPAWWVAADLPVLGSPLHTSRIIAAEADRVGRDVLPAVRTVADQLDRMHPAHGAIDLDPLAAAAPQLQSASVAAHTAALHVRDVAPSWLPYVSSARHSVATQLAELDGDLTGANRAAHLLLPMLGQQGPQRYFVGFLNEAEARGIGGIPGAFAIATADHGRITFEHFGTDAELNHVRASGLDLGADFTALYGQDDPTGIVANSDISPDFRNAAQIWAGMWRAKTGEHVDGAIALDPTALGYLLDVTGPAHAADGTVVSGSNVVALTQQKQYSLYPGRSPAQTAARKKYLVGIAKAVSTRLVKGGNPRALITAFSRAATERRLMVWSDQPKLEQLLEQAHWAAVLGAPAGTPYTGFVVTNGAGSKLDYYLDRSMTYRRSACGAGSSGVATLTLSNRAPRRGLPSYVTIRADGAPKGARPGDNRVLVSYYASAGATIGTVSLDGAAVPVVTGRESGLPVVTFPVELPAGSNRTITIHITEPAATRPLAVFRQPLVRPLSVRVDAPGCGS